MIGAAVAFFSLGLLLLIFMAGILCTRREILREREHPQPPLPSNPAWRDHHRKARAYDRDEVIK